MIENDNHKDRNFLHTTNPRNILENSRISSRKGLLALSPLAVFLIIYLASSIAARDFYSIPVSAAFLLASIYALLISGGGMKDKVRRFSAGASDGNVLLMIWIFVLAGAFAASAKAIGSVEATVNLTLKILPGKFLLAGLFLASCFISMSIGTSVGTIVALVPIATGIGEQAGLSIPMVTALITGGAFFGDNLSFISDTTIAATMSQGCSMKDKFRTNIWIAGPAALIITGVYVFLGIHADAHPEIGEIDFIKLLPYLNVIILAICGMNVMTVLGIGLGLCLVIGLFYGTGWTALLAAMGSGIGGMGDLIIVTLLAAGMLEMIRSNGGLDFLIGRLTRRIHGGRSAEFCIAALVSGANLCTANNTMAILTTGKITKEITERFSLDPRKSASILDTFSCVVQGIIPYGAQLLMASSLSGVAAVDIIPRLFYPMALLLTSCAAILFRFPRR